MVTFWRPKSDKEEVQEKNQRAQLKHNSLNLPKSERLNYQTVILREVAGSSAAGKIDSATSRRMTVVKGCDKKATIMTN